MAVCVDGFEGVAFRVVGPETAYDDATGDPYETGMVYVVALGDDYRRLVDGESIHEIADEDFCHQCGQIGCQHDGRD